MYKPNISSLPQPRLTYPTLLYSAQLTSCYQLLHFFYLLTLIDKAGVIAFYLLFVLIPSVFLLLLSCVTTFALSFFFFSYMLCSSSHKQKVSYRCVRLLCLLDHRHLRSLRWL
jgi:K+-sensing histidine kinase KdpD